MTDTRTVTCQDCGWKGTVAHCEPIAPRYLPERVAAGDIMPAGECPECGASAMLDADRPHPWVQIVTVPLPERATHFGVRSTARALADVMATARNAFLYRVQDMDRQASASPSTGSLPTRRCWPRAICGSRPREAGRCRCRPP